MKMKKNITYKYICGLQGLAYTLKGHLTTNYMPTHAHVARAYTATWWHASVHVKSSPCQHTHKYPLFNVLNSKKFKEFKKNPKKFLTF